MSAGAAPANPAAAGAADSGAAAAPGGAEADAGAAAAAAASAAAASELPVLDPVHNEYEKLHRIGEGTYGVVYKARHVPSGRIVALKKVRFERSREGVPVTSVRELRVLQQCSHPNIVRLERVVTGSKPDSVFLVFEYADHDLGRLLDSMATPFTESEVKCLVRQLLQAVSFLHANAVLHRDIKLSNLLYTSEGELKLCDFGLARHTVPAGCPLTPRVVTLWYRAPELLLGADEYCEAVDCWAVGCVMGELLRHEPLFPAQTERECLDMQCRLLGAPSPRIWPGMADLPGAAEARLPHQPYNNLRRSFPRTSEAGLALLNGLLTYDPARRLSARAALAHPYFSERPYPKRPQDMQTFPSSHHGPGGGAAAAPAAKPPPAGARPAAVDPYASPPHVARGGGGGAGGEWQRGGRGVADDGGRWGDVFGSPRDSKRRRGN